MVKRESCPSKIGPINLGTKQTGAPSAGNRHAGCDVAGAGNGFTVWLLRHSQRKRGAMVRLDLRNTAPVLDPTPWRRQSLILNPESVYGRLANDPVLIRIGERIGDSLSAGLVWVRMRSVQFLSWLPMTPFFANESFAIIFK